MGGTGVDGPSTATLKINAATDPWTAKLHLGTGAHGNQVAGVAAYGATGEVRIGGTATNYFPTFYAGASEAMRLTTAGRCGLGTHAPEAQLDVKDAAGTSVIKVQGAGVGYANAGLYLQANEDAFRGLGVLHHNVAGNALWFAGNPYSAAGAGNPSSDSYLVTRKAADDGQAAWSTATVAHQLFKIDSSGRVFKPQQPYFSGHSGSGSANNYHVVHTFHIKKNFHGNGFVAHRNIGGCMDTTTGLFTIPADGTYYLGPSRFCRTLFQIECTALHSYGPEPHSR